MDFSKLTEFLDGIDKNMIPQYDIAIYQDHKPIYRHMSGYADINGKKPLTGNELYFLYSATKVFTSTAGAIMLEKGYFKLNDKVSKYLPEFEELYINDNNNLIKATSPLTIKHLFTMCGGFNYTLGSSQIVEMRTKTNDKATTRQIVSAISKMPLTFEPGAKFQYSLCHDILAAVMEVVCGMRYSDILKKFIFEPLGIKDMTFRATPEIISRLATQYRYNNNDNKCSEAPLKCAYCLSDDYDSGGAGLIGGVNDYILLADSLACGGTGVSGNQIIKPETIDIIRSNQLSEQQYNSYATPVRSGYSYGLGVRTKIKNTEQNCKSPIGEFGWDGAAGSYILIDPENKLSIFYAQHVLGCGPVYSEVHQKIRDITYDIIK